MASRAAVDEPAARGVDENSAAFHNLYHVPIQEPFCIGRSAGNGESRCRSSAGRLGKAAEGESVDLEFVIILHGHSECSRPGWPLPSDPSHPIIPSVLPNNPYETVRGPTSAISVPHGVR